MTAKSSVSKPASQRALIIFSTNSMTGLSSPLSRYPAIAKSVPRTELTSESSGTRAYVERS